MLKDGRIPFEEALAEPLLFQKHFFGDGSPTTGLSIPQRSLLKQVYGAQLDDSVRDEFGFSELDYWAVFQGAVDSDDLGFPLRLHADAPAYVPRSFREAWLIVGRRGGKTDRFASTIVCYEALCGGHEAYVRKGQRAICFEIAQDLRMARYALHFIRATLESSPIGKNSIEKITADRIDLKHGVTIFCVPPTTKSVRGYANPVAVLDEVGMWYQESDSANPDYEIYRALTPGQIQFPNRKIVGITTPWNKAGMAWKNFEAGTEGYKLQVPGLRDEFKGVFVGHGATAAMGNPLVDRAYLQTERARDPRAFERECLAEFQDSISGFLPAALIEKATIPGNFENAPREAITYVAAIDPAFRHDAFALAIAHRDDKIHIDLIRRFEGSHSDPLNPKAVLEVIVPILRSYGISILYSDQYHLESLGQLAREYGIEIIGVQFTAKNKAQMYGNLQQLFHQGRICLIDHPEMKKELRMLERTLTEGGQVTISAPAGFHDDLATVVCLSAYQCMNLFPDQPKEEVHREPTHQERIEQQIANRRSVISYAWD